MSQHNADREVASGTPAQKHRLQIAQHNMDVWTLDRPAQISIVGRVLKAEEDLTVLGLSVVSGGAPSHERRISKAWSTFHVSSRPSGPVFPDAVGAVVLSHLACFGLGQLGLVTERHDQKQSGYERQPHDPQCYGPSQT